MFTVNLSFSKHDYNELTFKVKPVSISLVLKPIINLSVLSNYWEYFNNKSKFMLLALCYEYGLLYLV